MINNLAYVSLNQDLFAAAGNEHDESVQRIKKIT